MVFSDTNYLELLADASWYRRKFDRAAQIARAPRRFSAPLVELSLAAIRGLDERGRQANGRPGTHRGDLATDEGFGYARDYLAAITQIARMTMATPDGVHAAIRRGDRAAAPEPPVSGALASAMLGLVAGGSVATGNAMRTVERYARSRTFILGPPSGDE